MKRKKKSLCNAVSVNTSGEYILKKSPLSDKNTGINPGSSFLENCGKILLDFSHAKANGFKREKQDIQVHL